MRFTKHFWWISFLLLVVISTTPALYRHLIDTTVFAPQYNEREFDAVLIGQDIQLVDDKLGLPLLKYYGTIVPDDGRIALRGEPYFISDHCNYQRYSTDQYNGVDTNTSIYVYSISACGDSYRIRQLVVKNSKVVSKIHEFYYD